MLSYEPAANGSSYLCRKHMIPQNLVSEDLKPQLTPPRIFAALGYGIAWSHVCAFLESPDNPTSSIFQVCPVKERKKIEKLQRQQQIALALIFVTIVALVLLYVFSN